MSTKKMKMIRKGKKSKKEKEKHLRKNAKENIIQEKGNKHES